MLDLSFLIVLTRLMMMIKKTVDTIERVMMMMLCRWLSLNVIPSLLDTLVSISIIELLNESSSSDTQEHVDSKSNIKPVEQGLTLWGGHIHLQVLWSQNLSCSLHNMCSFSCLHWHWHVWSLWKCRLASQSDFGHWHLHLVSSATVTIAHTFVHLPDAKPHLDNITGIVLNVLDTEMQLWSVLWHPPPHWLTETWLGLIWVNEIFWGRLSFRIFWIGWQ